MRRGWAVAVTVALVALPACASSGSVVPDCDDPADRTMILAAQTVPSATMLPCVDALPPGWSVSGSSYEDGATTFWLDLPVAGVRAVEVRLTENCESTLGSRLVPAPDEAGADVFMAPSSLDPFEAVRSIVFEGGCVAYRYSFTSGTPATVSLEVDAALSFMPRADVVESVRTDPGETLCGAGAPPCDDRR